MGPRHDTVSAALCKPVPFLPLPRAWQSRERWKDVFFLLIGSLYHDTIMGLLDQLIELKLPPHIIPSHPLLSAIP